MQIKPYDKNAKKHNKKQIEAIAKSIKEFGMYQPIVVDKKGIIIVGHGRYAACQMLGMPDSEIPTIVANLTTKQAAAYRLADNKLNESDWDMALVLEELKGFDVEMLNLTGFDMKKLSDEFASMVENNKEIDIDGISSSLVHECPKCGFKFGKGAK